MKAQIRQQVEQDLKVTFDAKYEDMNRRLKDRDDKIQQLEQQYDSKVTEKSQKEKEMQGMRQQFERDQKAQEEKFQKLMNDQS